jgi:calcineurin-like phosphoesterase family protein
MFDYIKADTHFGHIHINTYEPSRMGKAQMEGYDYFDYYMIDEWNEKVKDTDTVLHLGDFAFKDGYKIAKKLKGKITLLKGNHDRSRHLEYYKNLGWKIIDSIVLEIEDAEIYYNEIENLYTSEEINQKLLACLICDINGKRVMFSHFPVFDNNPYDEKYKPVTSILEEIFEITNCDINIHGHTHSAGAKESFCKSACLELNEFKILKLSQFLQQG